MLQYTGELLDNVEAALRLRQYDADGTGHALLVSLRRPSHNTWLYGLLWRESFKLTLTMSDLDPGLQGVGHLFGLVGWS